MRCKETCAQTVANFLSFLLNEMILDYDSYINSLLDEECLDRDVIARNERYSAEVDVTSNK